MRYRSPHGIPSYVASGRERLQELAKLLETTPHDQLTFTRWFGDGKGCAVGLAAAYNPWFKAQGLRLEFKDSLKDCRPVYRGKTDWRAVAMFFEIDVAAARQLFDREGYDHNLRPRPEKVAAEIRALLAQDARVLVIA